jgi:hypothetical protein
MRYSSTTSGGTENPNPNLKPEEAYHFEAGYKSNIRFIGGCVFQPSIDIKAAATTAAFKICLPRKPTARDKLKG